MGPDWREFFEGFSPSPSAEAPPGTVAPPAARIAPPAQAVPEGARALSGAAARIASNMEASLEIPTATSFRFVPAKLLEENRRVINRWLASNRGGGKVSFTHLIGWAIVNALEAVPAMKRAFVEVGALQCGYCTPGMIMAAVALLSEKPKPSEPEIRDGMNGNLCRCCNYAKIVGAVRHAAKTFETVGR